MQTKNCINISQIHKGKQYRYRGFYNGEDHDEMITILNINYKKRNGGTVTMSNGIATTIEKDGTLYCLTKPH